MENRRRRSLRLEEKFARKVEEEINNIRRKSISPERGRSAETAKNIRQRRASLPAPPTHQVPERAPAGLTERVLHVRNFAETDKYYQMTAYAQAKLKHNIYGCAFNQYKEPEESQWLATVADTILRIYEFPVKDKTFKLLKEGMMSKGIPDSFYTVAWCKGRGQDGDKLKLAVGGKTGRIFIVDFDRFRIEKGLAGCRGCINDIRTNPVISTQIVVACEDKAVRLYDIRYRNPLVICGAIQGHMDNPLSVDWGTNGDCFYSAAYDHKILMWDMKDAEVAVHLRRATEAMNRGDDPPDRALYANLTVTRRELRVWDPENKALFVFQPKAQVNGVHFDAIDCIRISHSSNKGTDYIFSKNCGDYPQACLWRFGRIDPNAVENVSPMGWSRCHSTLQNFEVQNGWIPYFMKFGITLHPGNQYLCIGGQNGEIQIFDVVTGELIQTVAGRGGLIRQIDFSQCGEFFATVSDDGNIARYDKVGIVPPVVKESNGRVNGSTVAAKSARRKCSDDDESPDFHVTRRRSRRITAPTDDLESTAVSTGPVTRRRSLSVRVKKDDEVLIVEDKSPATRVKEKVSKAPKAPRNQNQFRGFSPEPDDDYESEDSESRALVIEQVNNAVATPLKKDKSGDKENYPEILIKSERCFSPTRKLSEELVEILYTVTPVKKTSSDPSEMFVDVESIVRLESLMTINKPPMTLEAVGATLEHQLTPENKTSIAHPDSVTRSGRRYSTTPEKDDEPKRKVIHYAPKLSYCTPYCTPKKKRTPNKH
ncbi:unnamed protein product [Caenorhabditis brenneri]